MKHQKKTKPALWTTVPAARKRLEAAAASRRSAKATLLAARRGKVAAKATKRRLARSRQPRKRVAPRSDRMAGRMAVSRRLKGEFMAVHRHCAGCGGAATEVHHVRGRVGPLLLDTTHWLAMCAGCHRWAHENINEARERNLIAQPGDWNRKD